MSEQYYSISGDDIFDINTDYEDSVSLSHNDDYDMNDFFHVSNYEIDENSGIAQTYEYLKFTTDEYGHVSSVDNQDVYTIMDEICNRVTDIFQETEVGKTLLNYDEIITDFGNFEEDFVNGFKLTVNIDMGSQSIIEDWVTRLNDYSIENDDPKPDRLRILVYTKSGNGDVWYTSNNIMNWNGIDSIITWGGNKTDWLEYSQPISPKDKVYIYVEMSAIALPGWKYVFGETCGEAGDINFRIDLNGGPMPTEYSDFVGYSPKCSYGNVFSFVCPSVDGTPVYLDPWEVMQYYLDYGKLVYPIGLYCQDGPVDMFDLSKGYKEISINLIAMCDFMCNKNTYLDAFNWSVFGNLPEIISSGDIQVLNNNIKSKSFVLDDYDSYETYDGWERTWAWINLMGFDNATFSTKYGFCPGFEYFFENDYSVNINNNVQLLIDNENNYIPTLGQMSLIFELYRGEFDECINIFHNYTGWYQNGLPFSTSLDFGTFEQFDCGLNKWVEGYRSTNVDSGYRNQSYWYNTNYHSTYSKSTGIADYVWNCDESVELICTDFTKNNCKCYLLS